MQTSIGSPLEHRCRPPVKLALVRPSALGRLDVQPATCRVARDTLAGTYTGLLAPTGTAGLLSNHIEYTVTSGTGRFLNGSGNIVGDGTLDFRSGVARADLVLDGTLSLPAVPEPSTWSLFLVGAGALGLALGNRARRQQASGTASS